jgi:hypothetical protein
MSSTSAIGTSLSCVSPPNASSASLPLRCWPTAASAARDRAASSCPAASSAASGLGDASPAKRSSPSPDPRARGGPPPSREGVCGAGRSSWPSGRCSELAGVPGSGASWRGCTCQPGAAAPSTGSGARPAGSAGLSRRMLPSDLGSAAACSRSPAPLRPNGCAGVLEKRPNRMPCHCGGDRVMLASQHCPGVNGTRARLHPLGNHRGGDAAPHRETAVVGGDRSPAQSNAQTFLIAQRG